MSLNNLLTAANDGHTRLSPKYNFDLKWNESAESAFSESKQILANATLLVHPDPSAPLHITCDASDFAVGGVLQQYIDNVWQPLSFFSKKLNPAETRYKAFDRELLAVYATIRYFRHNLEGRNFFVNTDHKPLTFVMSSVTERPSLRQSRQLAFIGEFTTNIRYVKKQDKFHRWRAVTTISVSHRQYISNKLQGIKCRSSFRCGIHEIVTFNVVYYELSTAQVIW